MIYRPPAIFQPQLELSSWRTTYTFRVRLRLTDVGPRDVIPKVVAMVVVVSFVSQKDMGAPPRRIPFLEHQHPLVDVRVVRLQPLSSGDAIILNMNTSPTSPRTTTLAESDPRQHAFCHSANTSEEEMEEKEDVNQNLHISWNGVCFLLRTSRRIARKARPRERAHESWMVDDAVRFELLSPSTYQPVGI